MNFGGNHQSGRLAAAGTWSFVAVAFLAVCCARTALAESCDPGEARPQVDAALARIERSVDPCGGSESLRRVLTAYRRCASTGYRICLDPRSERNFIERAAEGTGGPTTITWNPGLRTELEQGCGGERSRPVLRDPVASLLHEIVHVVQDCQGLEPSDHELEAVEIENIYRRARGMCQRTRYGERLLPPSMTVLCAPDGCRCETPGRQMVNAPAGDNVQRRFALPADASSTAGDTASRAPRLAR